MRSFVTVVFLLSLAITSAKEVRDTVWTRENDRIILMYNVYSDNNQFVISFSRPIISNPSDFLNKACKGELDKLKVVIFDRIGAVGKDIWKGLSPTAFMVPDGLSYEKTPEGFYILNQLPTIEFRKENADQVNINFPLYIAVYEKKHSYRIVSSSKQPFSVSSAIDKGKSGLRTGSRTGTEIERVAVVSSEELEAENSDITNALSSIETVKELLSRETEIPFSTTFQMAIYNLRSIRSQIKEPDIIKKIDDVFLLCSDKEQEIKESRNQSAIAAKAEEQALLQQQKQEAEAQQKESEEKARIQEEKQQKRTLWMIIGGVILAVLGFIGNAVFKHFRDIRNQKSIMQMQESIAKQAQHEAGRRSREIIRNKAHQMANIGRGKLRDTMNGTSKQTKNTKRRSI